jgi:hypothetical protein
MDDALGPRCDSVGSNDLTDLGQVGSVTGKLGKAAQFAAANNGYLKRVSNADLTTGNIDFTIAAWVKLENKSAPAEMAIVSKYGAGSFPNFQLEYYLGYHPPLDEFFFRVSPDNQNATVVQAQDITPVTGIWYLLVAWHNAISDTLNIQVNNGPVNSLSYSSGVATSTSPFMVGASSSGAGITDVLNGVVDEVGLWKRVLTADERTELYNSGQGWTHPSTCLQHYQFVFLPLIRQAPHGLHGYVTENGVPVGGITLELRFWNGTSWSTRATTATASDGLYTFTNIPSLSPEQYYYVRYLNPTTSTRLYSWHTQALGVYNTGELVRIGDFDIANVALVAPAAGATVSLPATFRWTPRPATPSDSYEFDLFDPDTGDPYFFTVPPLGYVAAYTLIGLPSGFSTGTPYVWNVWVYSPDGGYGISYYAYYVMFSTTGQAAMEGPHRSMETKDLPPSQTHHGILISDGW